MCNSPLSPVVFGLALFVCVAGSGAAQEKDKPAVAQQKTRLERYVERLEAHQVALVKRGLGASESGPARTTYVLVMYGITLSDRRVQVRQVVGQELAVEVVIEFLRAPARPGEHREWFRRRFAETERGRDLADKAYRDAVLVHKLNGYRPDSPGGK